MPGPRGIAGESGPKGGRGNPGLPGAEGPQGKQGENKLIGTFKRHGRFHAANGSYYHRV